MCSFGHTKFFDALLQERREEFKQKVSPVLVPFVYGPDFYGYNQSSSFSDVGGLMVEVECLERVTDPSQYSQEWREFFDFGGAFGPHNIFPNIILEDQPGTPTNPIELSDDDDGEMDVSLKKIYEQGIYKKLYDAALFFNMDDPCVVAQRVMTSVMSQSRIDLL